MTQVTPTTQRPDGHYTFVCVCDTIQEAVNLSNTIRGIVHAQRNNERAKLIKPVNGTANGSFDLPPSAVSPIPGGD